MKLQKILISLILFSLISVSESQAQGFALGLKGGLNFANQSVGSFPGEISSNTGFHGGAYTSVSLPGGLGFQVDALFVSQSNDWEGAGANIDDIRVRLQTLQVPVLLRMNFSVVNIHLGPQFNFILDGESTFGNTTTKIKDDLKSGEFGFVLGAGVRLPANLNVTARYIIGLSDINDDPNAFSDWRNSMFQVSLGYRLIGNK